MHASSGAGYRRLSVKGYHGSWLVGYDDVWVQARRQLFGGGTLGGQQVKRGFQGTASKSASASALLYLQALQHFSGWQPPCPYLS